MIFNSFQFLWLFPLIFIFYWGLAHLPRVSGRTRHRIENFSLIIISYGLYMQWKPASALLLLGVAINKPKAKIWCIDGDGAVLMHMGSIAVIGANRPKNLVHIVINNGAHETVDGMPTVAGQIDLVSIAKACGYPYEVRVNNFRDLDAELIAAKERNELSFIEVSCSIGARDDLGRPTTTALENKKNFMEYLKGL